MDNYFSWVMTTPVHAVGKYANSYTTKKIQLNRAYHCLHTCMHVAPIVMLDQTDNYFNVIYCK
jgi:alcohol dehydrogenase YqhD (iron-dependent ADH family)